MKMRKIKNALLEAIGVFDGVYAYKGPRVVQIDLTNKCNNDCIGCWCNSPLLEEKKLPKYITNSTLPTSLVIKLLDDLYMMGCDEIYFAGGGEPFMHPEAVKIFLYAKKKGFKVSINTNFTLVTKKIAEKLVKGGIDHLIVSVWAGKSKVYTSTHPNKSERDFLKLKEVLIYLNNCKKRKGDVPVIKIYNVLFNLNYFDFDNMLDFADETNSESVEFTLLDAIVGKTDKLLLNEKEKKDLLQSARKAKEKYGKENSPVFLANYDTFLRRLSEKTVNKGSYDKSAFDNFKCYAGWAFARIIASGDVNSCLKSHRIPIGNLHKNDFRYIWNNARQREFRRKTKKFDITDPYFRFIGNNPRASVGCFRSCDNLGHSALVENNLKRIPIGIKIPLNMATFCLRQFRNLIDGDDDF